MVKLFNLSHGAAMAVKLVAEKQGFTVEVKHGRAGYIASFECDHVPYWAAFARGVAAHADILTCAEFAKERAAREQAAS